MSLSLGTFNLKNLFSRYNFTGEIQAIAGGELSVDGTLSYAFCPTIGKEESAALSLESIGVKVEDSCNWIQLNSELECIQVWIYNCSRICETT